MKWRSQCNGSTTCVDVVSRSQTNDITCLYHIVVVALFTAQRRESYLADEILNPADKKPSGGSYFLFISLNFERLAP